MTKMIVIYITCPSVEDAKRIGRHLLTKRLCACVNILDSVHPMYFWPPKSGVIDESSEVVMLVKTIESKYEQIENEVNKVHLDDTVCLFEIPISRVNQKYLDWLKSEIE